LEVSSRGPDSPLLNTSATLLPRWIRRFWPETSVS